MPNLSEIIRIQATFERERNLYGLNTKEYGLGRMAEELEEAKQELDDPEKMLVEVADVVIFGMSVMLHLLDELGLPPEKADEVVVDKLGQNFEKYNPIFFKQLDTLAAIKKARHWHKLKEEEQKVNPWRNHPWNHGYINE